jgi:hypothetical protein
MWIRAVEPRCSLFVRDRCLEFLPPLFPPFLNLAFCSLFSVVPRVREPHSVLTCVS